MTLTDSPEYEESLSFGALVSTSASNYPFILKQILRVSIWTVFQTRENFGHVYMSFSKRI